VINSAWNPTPFTKLLEIYKELIANDYYQNGLRYAAAFEYLRDYDSDKAFGFDYMDEPILKHSCHLSARHFATYY
jgi:hypothetical protein